MRTRRPATGTRRNQSAPSDGGTFLRLRYLLEAAVPARLKAAQTFAALTHRVSRRSFWRQMDVLFLILILSTGALLGNEFSIGTFIHPALSRSDAERFLPAIQVFARLFGKIMPVWMPATLLVHLTLLVLTWSWPAISTVLLLVATLLWVAIIVFSLLGPVPINDRVKDWDIQYLPPDWRQQRQRWDRLNAIRVVMIALAFLALVVSYRTLHIL